MKNKKVVIPLAIFLLIVGATLVKSQLNKMESQKQAEAALKVVQADTTTQLLMHEEYPNVPETNHFTREPADEIVNRLRSGTGVVFLGFKECPWCQKTAPILNEAAESVGVPIYYLDIRQERANKTPAYLEIVSILSPYLQPDADGNPTISTPDISFVREGEIVGRFKMEATAEAERTPETYWTEERKERALRVFKEEIKNMEEA